MDFWVKLQQDFYQSFIEGDRWLMYLKGLGVTLQVTLGALLFGVLLGTMVAVIRSMHDQRRPGQRNPLLKVANGVCHLYLTVIRGTPVMVQLLIIYFAIFANTRNTLGVAILTFGINSGAYVAEIIRGGIMSVDGGQMEAGRSLGLTYAATMRHIVVPQAIKNILPALGNEMITLVKETSIVTVIGLRDITKAALLIQGKTYQAFMPFIGVAVVYLVLVLVLTKLIGCLERRLRKSDKR